MKKKLICICVILVVAMMCATSTLAVYKVTETPQAVVGRVSGSPYTHTYAITPNYTLNEALQRRLNCYVEGTPYDGCKVPTWPNTGDETQLWGSITIAATDPTVENDDIFVPHANPNVCLNILRSGSEPVANVASIIGNRFGDIVIVTNNTAGRVYVGPRYIHSTNMYLRETTSLSSGGKNVVWSSTGSTFYLYDDSWNRFD